MRHFALTISGMALILTALVCEPSDAQAQEVAVKGKACERYTELTPDVMEEAEIAAKQAAWKKYRGKYLTKSQKSIYRKNKDEFIDSLDDLLLDSEVQSEKDNSKRKKYCVLLLVKFDKAGVEEMFNYLAGDPQESFGSAAFGAMFIARVEAFRTAYDTNRADVSETSENALLKEESYSTDSESVDSSESKSLSVKKSGGSTTRKRDKVEYAVSMALSETLNSAIGEQLTQANFQPRPVFNLDDVTPLDELAADDKFRGDGRLPTRVVKEYINAAIDKMWDFLGLGMIDVSSPMDDPATGELKVTASVSFTVYDLSEGEAKSVSQVRERVISVIGNDVGAMEKIAANKAAKEAMDVVISQMQKQGIQ